jgi:hypothetical protein
MRTMVLVALSTLALAACNRQGGGQPAASSGAGAVAVSQMPTRKAGLWEQSMVHDGAAPGIMGKVRACIDAASERKLSLFGGRMRAGKCSRWSVSRALNGAYHFTTTCDMDEAGVTTTAGTLTGDLGRAYHIHSLSNTTGSSIPSMNGPHVTDITSTYLGPCPAGMIPGDVVMANGIKVNVNKLAGAVSGGG